MARRAATKMPAKTRTASKGPLRRIISQKRGFGILYTVMRNKPSANLLFAKNKMRVKAGLRVARTAS